MYKTFGNKREGRGYKVHGNSSGTSASGLYMAHKPGGEGLMQKYLVKSRRLDDLRSQLTSSERRVPLYPSQRTVRASVMSGYRVSRRHLARDRRDTRSGLARPCSVHVLSTLWHGKNPPIPVHAWKMWIGFLVPFLVLLFFFLVFL